MTAVPEAITVFDVMACLSAPIAHLAVVVTPGMYGPVADCYLGSTASLAFEIWSLVHVAIDTTTNAGYGVSSGKTVRAPVHSQAFVLKGLLQGSDVLGDLASFGVVCMKVLDFAL